MAFLSTCKSVQKLPERFRLYLHLIRAYTSVFPLDSFSGMKASSIFSVFYPGAVLSFLRRLSRCLSLVLCFFLALSSSLRSLRLTFIRISLRLVQTSCCTWNLSTTRRALRETGHNTSSHALRKVHSNLKPNERISSGIRIRTSTIFSDLTPFT